MLDDDEALAFDLGYEICRAMQKRVASILADCSSIAQAWRMTISNPNSSEPSRPNFILIPTAMPGKQKRTGSFVGSSLLEVARIEKEAGAHLSKGRSFGRSIIEDCFSYSTSKSPAAYRSLAAAMMLARNLMKVSITCSMTGGDAFSPRDL